MATLTVYPDPDPETTTIDGDARRSSVNETFSTIRGGAGTAMNDTAASHFVTLAATSTSNQYSELRRFIALFNTASLTASANISSAVLSLFGTGKTNGLGDPDLHIASSTPASNTTLATGDYSNVGSTSFGNVTYAGFSTVAYNDITLDSNGIANISKTGVSKFSALLSWDINNSFTGAWSSLAQSYLSFNSADQGATTNDPKLVVTYTLETFLPKVMII